MTIIRVYGKVIGEITESAPFSTRDELLELIGYDETTEERLCNKYGWEAIEPDDIEVIRENEANSLMRYYQKMGIKIDEAYYDGKLTHEAIDTYDAYFVENKEDFNYARLSMYFLNHGFIDLNEVVNR